ncbi:MULTISPECIES: 50S ribosomal protein L10 [Nitrospirillum]|uniref:Large ribosomal subunit protein uL10 n=1 Tax=Nitrospirillum amazonense TaxID=28077 RepID=A0A560HWR8_9PROT|nr:50S ribosomal protein L10 [Nitrospirillum amazonense]MDG3441078.1 50S ribosomal protein L10 [Nitrospirillum amazonense]TWB09531.1 LSU ribosomal protein L10P [Nitrospirillum amazonense]TWB49979.1 LSU ribosomal protein L10P [Nitrospirillum amazonense]TWB65664.1 LSU ribosomal protein L10P [Nitrospirillum amazonense]
MDRTEKQATIAALHQALSATSLVVVTRQSGMTVAEVTDLRRKMRAAGASFKVTKNRLARIALKGTQFEKLDDLFVGVTAIAYSSDPVAAAKVAIAYAKANDKFKIIGGGMGGTVLDDKGIEALSKLPSIEELRGRLLGMLQTPATRIAGVLQAPGGQVARVLSAYAKKGEAA